MKFYSVLLLIILLSLSCSRTELSFSEEKIYDKVNFYSFEIKNDDLLTDLEIRQLTKRKPYLNTLIKCRLKNTLFYFYIHIRIDLSKTKQCSNHWRLRL